MLEAREEIRLAIILASLLVLVLALLIIMAIILYRVRQQRHSREKTALRAEFQQAMLQAQLEIQEQTLQKISQEIHDNIGQALSLAKLNLNTMLPQHNTALEEKIINSKTLVSKAIGDLRSLSRSLDTDYVKEMGLQRAIEYELEMIHKTGTINTSLHVDGSAIRLGKQKELILFRIIQETFNNIIKHAEAANLRVSVCYTYSSLEITIDDDGKGVDLRPLNEENNQHFGLGIRNMHSRANLIGAVFTMNSTLGAGTRVSIVLPLELQRNESTE